MENIDRRSDKSKTVKGSSKVILETLDLKELEIVAACKHTHTISIPIPKKGDMSASQNPAGWGAIIDDFLTTRPSWSAVSEPYEWMKEPTAGWDPIILKKNVEVGDEVRAPSCSRAHEILPVTPRLTARPMFPP